MAFLANLGIKLLLHGIDCKCCPSEATQRVVPALGLSNGVGSKAADNIHKVHALSTNRAETVKLALDTDYSFSIGHDSPATAVDKLHYGANSFTSEEFIVAKGHFVEFSIEMPHIWSLFLFRTSGDHLRLAQIELDGDCRIVKNRAGRLKGGVMTLLPAIYKFHPNDNGDYLLEFYFISRI